MTSWVEQTIAGGFLPWAMALAFAGGVVSFASPCVVPLVPGFLGYITGLTPRDQQSARARFVLGAMLFVLGFTVVFLALGVVVSSAGLALANDRGLLMRVGGVVVILVGLVMALGTGGRSWQVTWRPAAGLLGAPVLGAVFGLGFSACIGPVLAAVLTLSTSLSGSQDVITRGVVLAVCYSLGLGAPFVLVAAGLERATRASQWLRDRHRVISGMGGAVLVFLGTLMVTGLWDRMMVWLQVSVTSTFQPAL